MHRLRLKGLLCPLGFETGIDAALCQARGGV